MVAGLRAAPRSATYDALVLDAALRQSLVSVRSLGRRGIPVGVCGPTVTRERAMATPSE